MLSGDRFASFLCPDCTVKFTTLSHLQAHWLREHHRCQRQQQTTLPLQTTSAPAEHIGCGHVRGVDVGGVEARHAFRNKQFRKTQRCDLCQQPLRDQGASCRACKYCCHLHCEPKVISSCDPKQSYELSRSESRELRHSRRSKSPGSRSLERTRSPRSLERQLSFAMDVTYVTEKIIVVTFPEGGLDTTYRSNLKEVTRMLRTKHGDKYTVFNLSEKRHDLARLNSQIVEFGWPAHLSPPLERLCSICKSLDSWFHADSQNVAILHSKGDKGRVGVVLAAYLHYTSICASDNQALDRLTMRRYYEDKLYSSMHPSQRRYVHYFTELLSGNIKMNNNALYLHHLILHGIPNFDNRGGCRPFFKIYQGMQPVYTSGVHVATDGSRRLVVPLEANQALRGDVLIKCYHKKQRPAGRTPIFRVQFHTCTLEGGKVFFAKADLDDAVSDPRFPDDGQVELLFSDRPDDYRGNGSVTEMVSTADQTKDPLVRHDSYENFDLIHEDSQSDLDDLIESTNISVPHAEGPLDGNLYAVVSKAGRQPVDGGPFSPSSPNAAAPDTDVLDGPHTVSMDSGISSSSGLHNYGNPSPQGLLHKVPNGGTVEVEVHHSADGGHPHQQQQHHHHQQQQQPGRSPLRSEHAELDDLLDGMLREIRSMPNHPASPPPGSGRTNPSHSYGTLPHGSPSSLSNPGHGTIYCSYTSRTTSSEPPTAAQRNGGGDHLAGYQRWPLQHQEPDGRSPDSGHRTTSPFSYGVEYGSPALRRRRAHSESARDSFEDRSYGTLRDASLSPEPVVGSQSWLQKQQQKLRARREGSWEDRHRKERQLIAELRTATAMRSPEPPNGTVDMSPLNGDVGTLKGTNFSTPLHIHTSSKPPIHRGLSAPTSPIIPSRTSSRDVTLRRYPQWQPQPLPTVAQPIVRQKSDTSFDRERPFMEAKRSHQQARDQMAAGDPAGTSPLRLISSSVVYGDPSDPARRPGVLAGSPHSATSAPPPRRDDILAMLNDPPFSTAVKASSPVETAQYKVEEPVQLHEMAPIAQSTPNKYTQDDSSLEGSSPWPTRGTDDSPSASPSSATDRPATPAFPVPPRTPYMNQDSSGGLPPKSPTLSRRRSPSPATVSALQQSLPQSSGLPTSPNGQSSPTVYFGQSRRSSMLSLTDSPEVIHHHPVFVKDTSKYWYKPNISREEAIHVLKTKPPGTFIVRDSNSFPGAFGLALKVASPPPNVQTRSGDPSNELVRHFLIEPTAKGVRLKGCANEPVFGSLSALVYQHSITPLALPCRLLLPESEIGGVPVWAGDVVDSTTAPTTAATASSLLQQGAACNVLYLCTMDMESLTGPQAVRRAMAELLAISPPPVPTVVHFKVSSQGITLTDNNRKLFFRRHYALNAISFCGTDPDDRRWTQKDEDAGVTVTARCFGFVARKPASKTDNQCHLFAELDPEQPASAIVNFVGKVMDGAGISATRANMI
ncbi:focal adhesion protein tensin isoform X3 [Dermacentor variabilis]|uniref:focal adhesion protein tensin isoform X3 n=1 Tax=Dermacentor variabilis TaxID=34621 RepID=UPI003F5C26D8